MLRKGINLYFRRIFEFIGLFRNSKNLRIDENFGEYMWVIGLYVLSDYVLKGKMGWFILGELFFILSWVLKFI